MSSTLAFLPFLRRGSFSFSTRKKRRVGGGGTPAERTKVTQREARLETRHSRKFLRFPFAARRLEEKGGGGAHGRRLQEFKKAATLNASRRHAFYRFFPLPSFFPLFSLSFFSSLFFPLPVARGSRDDDGADQVQGGG